MTHRSLGILGGGISGVALASFLGDDVEVVERRPRIGGLCGTIIEDGFTFDASGPHIQFIKKKEGLSLKVASLGVNVHLRRREIQILFQHPTRKYPVEN